MPSKRQVAANKRNSRRNAEQMRRMRMIAKARRQGPIISLAVLKALASSKLPADRWLTTFACKSCWERSMRREKKFAEPQARWLVLQAERRRRKMKTHPQPGAELCHAPGADAAAVDGKSRRYETEKAAAALFNSLP